MSDRTRRVYLFARSGGENSARRRRRRWYDEGLVDLQTVIDHQFITSLSSPYLITSSLIELEGNDAIFSKNNSNAIRLRARPMGCVIFKLRQKVPGNPASCLGSIESIIRIWNPLLNTINEFSTFILHRILVYTTTFLYLRQSNLTCRIENEGQEKKEVIYSEECCAWIIASHHVPHRETNIKMYRLMMMAAIWPSYCLAQVELRKLRALMNH